MRELATGRYIANAENVFIVGPPGVGKTHLAIALGRAAVETGHAVLFVSATTLLAALARAEAEGQLDAKLACAREHVRDTVPCRNDGVPPGWRCRSASSPHASAARAAQAA